MRARRPFTGERLGPELRNLMAQTARSFGFSVPDLLMAWPEIVGERLASRAYPEKLSRRGAGGGTLTLRCRGAAALEVQHELPRIRDRLNTFLGSDLIETIKIVQGEVPLPAEKRAEARRPLTPSQTQELTQRLEGIDNPALKSAFQRLGAAIITRQTATKS